MGEVVGIIGTVESLDPGEMTPQQELKALENRKDTLQEDMAYWYATKIAPYFGKGEGKPSSYDDDYSFYNQLKAEFNEVLARIAALKEIIAEGHVSGEGDVYMGSYAGYGEAGISPVWYLVGALAIAAPIIYFVTRKPKARK